MATVQQVTNIMGEFYEREMESTFYKPFFDSNDIGMPLAYMAWAEFATPTDKSVPYLNNTWLEFCEIFGMDPLCSFDNLQQFLDFALDTSLDTPQTT